MITALRRAAMAVLALAAVITGTAHGAAFPILSSEVVNRARVSERGSAMATFTALFDIALLVGAPAAGFILTRADKLFLLRACRLALAQGGQLMTTTDVDIADETVREALAAATHFTGSLLASEDMIEAQPSAL